MPVNVSTLGRVFVRKGTAENNKDLGQNALQIMSCLFGLRVKVRIRVKVRVKVKL